MIAELIGFGERLTGDVLDHAARFIAKELRALGITLSYQTLAGSSKAALQRTLAAALDRSDIIFTVGGLGSGPQDLVKEYICESVGLTLEPNAAVVRHIKEYFDRRKQPYPASGSTYVQNAQGRSHLPRRQLSLHRLRYLCGKAVHYYAARPRGRLKVHAAPAGFSVPV